MTGKTVEDVAGTIMAKNAQAEATAATAAAEEIVFAREKAADAEKRHVDAEGHLDAAREAWQAADREVKLFGVTTYDAHGNAPVLSTDEKAKRKGKRIELADKAQKRFGVYEAARTTHDTAELNAKDAWAAVVELERIHLAAVGG